MATDVTVDAVSGARTEAPESAANAAERKLRHKMSNKAFRLGNLPRVVESRVSSGVDFSGHTFATDYESRSRIRDLALEALCALQLGEVTADQPDWRIPSIPHTYGDVDGRRVPLTPSDTLQLARVVGAKERRERLRAQILKSQLEANQDIDTDHPSAWGFNPEV